MKGVKRTPKFCFPPHWWGRVRVGVNYYKKDK